MSTRSNQPVGVALMTYGSATTSKDVLPYMRHVYGGHEPSAELVEEFERRYDLVGPSPLIELTRQQGEALERLMAERVGEGRVIVEIGMQHSASFIAEAVEKLRQRGAARIVGLLLSPQYSPLIMGGYEKTLRQSAEENGYSQDQVVMIGPWPIEEKFIQLTSQQLLAKYDQLKQQYSQPIPVVFTTHSLPERVVQKDLSYLDQLQQTIQAILARTDLPADSWSYAYQSAGHTPEPWLKPDLVDILPDLKEDAPAILIVPIQFLTDHLEILYDLDVAAREQVEEAGMAYYRIALPNLDPLFIDALGDLVEREVSKH